jgi:hypothetical protein
MTTKQKKSKTTCNLCCTLQINNFIGDKEQKPFEISPSLETNNAKHILNLKPLLVITNSHRNKKHKGLGFKIHIKVNRLMSKH